MSIPKSSQLALGTVQFGLNYGISNTNGVVNKNQIKLILSQAYKSNINTLDTAIVYGESEGILGDIGIDDFNVLTKLPPVPENQADIRNWAIDNIYSSMKKLNVSSLYALLLHNSVDILGASVGIGSVVITKITSNLKILVSSTTETHLVGMNYSCVAGGAWSAAAAGAFALSAGAGGLISAGGGIAMSAGAGISIAATAIVKVTGMKIMLN